MEVLSTFTFIIKYRRGKDNPIDGLSRRPDYIVRSKEVRNPLIELLYTRILGIYGM